MKRGQKLIAASLFVFLSLSFAILISGPVSAVSEAGCVPETFKVYSWGHSPLYHGKDFEGACFTETRSLFEFATGYTATKHKNEACDDAVKNGEEQCRNKCKVYARCMMSSSTVDEYETSSRCEDKNLGSDQLIDESTGKPVPVAWDSDGKPVGYVYYYNHQHECSSALACNCEGELPEETLITQKNDCTEKGMFYYAAECREKCVGGYCSLFSSDTIVCFACNKKDPCEGAWRCGSWSDTVWSECVNGRKTGTHTRTCELTNEDCRTARPPPISETFFKSCGDTSTASKEVITGVEFTGVKLILEVKESSVLLNGMNIAEKAKGQSYVSSNLMVTYSMGTGKVGSTASVPSKYSSTGALIQSDLGDGKKWYYLKEVDKDGEDIFEGKEKATVSWEYPLLEDQDWKPAGFRDNLIEIPEGEDAHFITNGNLVLPGQFIIYSVDDDEEAAKAQITDPSADCSAPNKRCSATLKTSDLDEGYYHVVYTWESGGKTYISNSQGVKIGNPGDDGKEEVVFTDAQTGEEKKLLWTPKYAQYYGTWGNVNKEDITVYQWSDNPSGISIGTSTSEVKYAVDVGAPLEHPGTATFSAVSFEIDTDWKTHTTLVFDNKKNIRLTYDGGRIILKPSATGDWGNGLVLTNESDQAITISRGNVLSTTENDSVRSAVTTPVEASNLNDTTSDPIGTKTLSGRISGLTIDQMDFDVSGLNIMDSNFGRLTVSPESKGYLNMYTDFGWVIRNLYLNNMITTTYFDLGNRRPSDITTLSAYIDIKDEPQLTFSDSSRTIYPVSTGVWDAEGVGAGGNISSGPVLMGGDLFIEIAIPPPPVIRPNYTYSLPNVSNKEAADNQCVPLSVANSLQYLKDAKNINVQDDHRQGLKGDNSLVGKLDTEMNRSLVSRRSGTGVWFDDMLEGKFSYLNKNGLGDKLINKHQGRGWGKPLPDGDFTAYGVTSRDDGNTVTFNWLCQQIKDGEDVEIIFSYEDAAGNITGGHAVRVFECGETLGAPWIGFAHDSDQSNDGAGLETPRQNVLDSDGDGNLNIFGNTSEILFAVSESAINPPVQEKGTISKVWDWIAGWFS